MPKYQPKAVDADVASIPSVGQEQGFLPSAPPNYTADSDGDDGAIRGDTMATIDTKKLEEAANSLAAASFLADPNELNSLGTGIHVDACLAHLKLLHAIQSMKIDIGYTDCLWNIWNTRADFLLKEFRIDGLDERAQHLKAKPIHERKQAALSRIREKRWAIFVARAVDRYEAWWNTLKQEDGMLKEEDMSTRGSSKYMEFPNVRSPLVWEEHMLPPLDVLMIFHSHMLNPRSFLEDAMRHGLPASFWATGMPWSLINAAIDKDFNFSVSNDARRHWTTQTGREWENADDSNNKVIPCPYCHTEKQMHWTTCGFFDHEYPKNRLPGLKGFGYGDGAFRQRCDSCGKYNNKKRLALSKFVADATLLLDKSVPMPGTILDPKTGQPAIVPGSPDSHKFPRTFPNRLIQKELRDDILKIFKIPDGEASKVEEENIANKNMKDKEGRNKADGKKKKKTADKTDAKTSARTEILDMRDIRKLIETVILTDKRVRNVDSSPGFFYKYIVPEIGQISVRKMMSRYWENFSPFALDLCQAVMRQGVFIEKMNNIDWLHSPNARDTMTRLIQKYDRFMQIIAKYPKKVVVPTLDVDLAWHTHQLSPAHYYRFTVLRTKRFIDHDDKIDDYKLEKWFEWTTEKYQEMFGTIYSECTCWYCEAVRSSKTSSIGRFLHLSSSESISEDFHSGAAATCPPDKSAHISAHNSVKAHETSAKKKAMAQLRERHILLINREYIKAAKRAEKKGRKLPPKDEYYSHWGESYYVYGPWMYPAYLSPEMYSGWDPSSIQVGAGLWANCAGGSCGNGGIAAGACGGGGGCGNHNGPSCSTFNGSVGGAGGGGGAGCGGGCGGS